MGKTLRYDHTVTAWRWFRRRMFDLRAWTVRRLGGSMIRGKCLFCDRGVPLVGTTPYCTRLVCKHHEG